MCGKNYIYRRFAGCKGNHLPLAYFKMVVCIAPIFTQKLLLIRLKLLFVPVNAHLI